MAAVALAALLVGCSSDDPLTAADEGAAPGEPAAAAEEESDPTASAAADGGSGESGANGTSPASGESGLLPVAIAYAYQPDTRLTYRVEVDGTIDVEADVPAGLGESTTGRLGIAGETDLTYLIGPGPDDGTFEIRLTADFAELSVTGDLGDLGDEALPFPGLDLGDALGDLPAVDLTVIVDEQGAILERSPLAVTGLGQSFDDVLAGSGLAESLDMTGLGTNVSGPLGPIFPAGRPLDVGSAWTDRTESRVGDMAIATDYAHEVTGVAELDGAEVVVVETVATVGGFEIGLADLVESVLADLEAANPGGGEADMGFGGMDLEEMLVMVLGGLQMSVGAAPAVAETTTWISLDRTAAGPAAGIVRQAVTRSSGTVRTEFTVPGETDADFTVTVRTEYAQDVRFTLTGADRL